jgi:hypothetical protein
MELWIGYNVLCILAVAGLLVVATGIHSISEETFLAQVTKLLGEPFIFAIPFGLQSWDQPMLGTLC